MNRKVIVSDLDGTLFNSDEEGSKVSQELIKEIQKFKKKGNIFTIATGRPQETALEVAKAVGINAPYITNNGAKVIDIDGREIYSQEFSLEEWIPFLQNLDELGASIIITHSGKTFCLRRTERISLYEKKENTQCIEFTREILKQIQNVHKILVIGEVKKYKEAWSKLENSIQEEFRYMISEDDYFEILKNNVSKGNGLKILKKHLGINDNQVISIGNHMNDKELIEEAHIGYAVANATVGLKNIADYVTRNEYEKGVIEIIRKYS